MCVCVCVCVCVCERERESVCSCCHCVCLPADCSGYFSFLVSLRSPRIHMCVSKTRFHEECLEVNTLMFLTYMEASKR